MKALLTLVLSCIGLATAAPLPPADLLASNTVVAEYTGVIERPCMHRTALCPDRCDHAMKVGGFKVVSNENYEKKGEYGDAKAEVDSTVVVDIKRDVEGQDPAVKALIETLKPGDKVKLTIKHYYVTNPANQYPVRPCVSIEKL